MKILYSLLLFIFSSLVDSSLVSANCPTSLLPISLQAENLVKESGNIPGCMDLQVGQSSVINQADGKAVYKKYSIERTGPNSHRLRFNLTFWKNGVRSTQLDDNVRNCLAQVNPYLAGPSGERIEMIYNTPEQTENLSPDKKAPGYGINIANAGTEPNSRNYPADISCASIIHEMLHLTGLVDEYEQKGKAQYVDKQTNKRIFQSQIPGNVLDTKRYAYVGGGNYCRVRAKGPSIMKSEQIFLNLAIPREFTCYCNNLTCKSTAELPQNLQHFQLLSSFNIEQWVPELLDVCTSSLKFIKSIRSVGELPTTKIFEIKNQSSSSISFTQNHFRENSLGLGSFDKTEYSCQCGNSGCQSAMVRLKTLVAAGDKLKPYSCPASFSTKPVGSDLGIKVNYTPPFEVPLLRAGQLAKILGGACPTKARRYSTCTSFAYIVTDKYDKCGSVPKYCLTDSGWLDSSL